MCVLTLKSSHRPDGKLAHTLALILACATATDASINYSRCVPQRPAISHRPDGILTCVALVLAGRRCVHQQRHGELLIVHHHRQHGSICACSRSKVPIAPMEFSHILRVRLQGGGVYVYGGSVTFSSCTITDNSAYDVRDHAQKFPSPRWENC